MVVPMIIVTYPPGRFLCKGVSHPKFPCRGFFLGGEITFVMGTTIVLLDSAFHVDCSELLQASIHKHYFA